MPSLLLSSLFHLGPRQMALYAIYQLGLRTGHYRRSMPVGGRPVNGVPQWRLEAGPFVAPAKERLRETLGEGVERVVAEADEVVAGQVRLFGGEPEPLVLALPGPLQHWTVAERGKQHWEAGRDIKFVWEPGRFAWVYPLGRAYILTGDERYPQTFWRFAEQFLDANPPNLGPHWASAQEVAIRMLALIFAGQVFARSPQAAAWNERLPRALVEHAQRIPATLVYARSQNNNHLLTEALGLYAAGLLLPDWPEASAWRGLGWKWLNHAFQTQIDADGIYVQQSTNYHRLMLHVALLAQALAQRAGETLPELTRERLAAATLWLADHTDPTNGEMTNLGANDGANLLPLASAPFRDARPTLQAAARAFLGRSLLPAGGWDEVGQWIVDGGQWADGSRRSTGLGEQAEAFGENMEQASGEMILGRRSTRSAVAESAPAALQPFTSSLPTASSWASLRAAWFTQRPSHADQLHVEIWWRGVNLARDAGTYLYNAPRPWENALAGTAVHNTLTIDDADQMRRAGRFLWLDWAQASLVEPDADLDGSAGLEAVVAVQDGYRKLGVLHRRSLARLDADTWQVTDNVLPYHTGRSMSHTARVQWLLPDWPWTLDDTVLTLASPLGPVSVELATIGGKPLLVSLFRAGEKLAGRYAGSPLLGWYSPTYGVREPALSLTAEVSGALPLRFITRIVMLEKLPAQGG